MNFKPFIKHSGNFLVAILVCLFYWIFIFSDLWKKPEPYMGVVGVLVGLFWIGLVIYTSFDWIDAAEELAHEAIKIRERKKHVVTEALFKYTMLLCLFILQCVFAFHVLPMIYHIENIGPELAPAFAILDIVLVVKIVNWVFRTFKVGDKND